MNDNTKIIDGSIGEGGGSILRLSAGFSFLYNQPIHIINIRANRNNPGLRQQHLLGLKTLVDLTQSYLSSCQVGSKEIKFIPSGIVKKSEITINVNTAASIGLLLQPIQIACLNLNNSQSVRINIHGGGTYGKWAPSLNYLEDVTYKIFRRLLEKLRHDQNQDQLPISQQSLQFIRDMDYFIHSPQNERTDL